MRRGWSILSSPSMLANPAHAREILLTEAGPVPIFRAEAQSERAMDPSAPVTEPPECSHVAHTGSKTRVNKGIQARAVDTRTSARPLRKVEEVSP